MSLQVYFSFFRLSMQLTSGGLARLTRSNQVTPFLCQLFSISRPSWKNHYEVLGVGRQSSAEEIRAAFIAMAKKNHPDNDPDNPELPTRFIEIKEAYDALGTHQKRMIYDSQLLNTSNNAKILSYEELQRRNHEQFARVLNNQRQHWKSKEAFETDTKEIAWTFSFRGKSFTVKPLSPVSMIIIGLSSWIILSMIIHLMLRF